MNRYPGGGPFMQRVLVFGDTHIPSRRDGIPDPFYRHVKATRYDFALVTGDLVHEDAMRAALPPLPTCYIVRGNMDYNPQYDFHHQLQIEEFQVLLLHGTQIRPRGNIKQLHEIAENVGADVTIHGHTHKADITVYRGRLFLNPGTMSGATGGWRGRDDASFMELEFEKDHLHVVLHLTDWQTVKQSEISYRKTDGTVVRVG